MTKEIASFGPLKNPTYAVRLMEHLQSRIDTVPRSKGWSYKPVRLEDLIHHKSWWAWEDVKSRNKLHKYAEHVRSSQVFALNLFGALPERGVTELLSTYFGPMGSVERPFFEFEDPQDRLRESPQKGQQTQVDVIIRGRTVRDEPVALLVEVKLTETDFGVCSGADDPKNDTLHLCGTSGPFGSDPMNCFKLRNHGGPERRLYDRYIPLSVVSASSPFKGCSFRTSAYQPMRNVALAGVLHVEDGVRTVVAVCAPLLHRQMWDHFNNASKVLPPGSLLPLPGEVVLGLHDEDSYEFLRERYFLDIGCTLDDRDERELSTWRIISALDETFEHQFHVFETHPGGGQYDCITLAVPGSSNDGRRVDFNRDGRIHVFAAGDKHQAIDDGWQTANEGFAKEVAIKIGELLGLATTTRRGRSPCAVFERVIELGRMAGETFQWRCRSEQRSSEFGDENILCNWTVERVGTKYDYVEMKSVFVGCPQFGTAQ